MPISSIGSIASVIPSFELSGRESNDQGRLAVTQMVASSGEEHVSNRSIAMGFVDFGLTFNRRLQFVVDHQSNEVIVNVIDSRTEEVVRVVPPEELQRLHRNLRDASGFLFSQRA